jgi:hypothetical protein
MIFLSDHCFERSAEEKPSVLITVACFSSSSINFPGQNLHIGGGVCFAPGRGPNTVSALGNPHHDSRAAEEPEGRLILRALTRSRVAPLARLLRSQSQCRAINKIWGDYRRLECDPRFTLSVFMGWMKLAKRRALRFLAAAALRSLVFSLSPCSIICAHHFYSLSHKQAERILRIMLFASLLCSGRQIYFDCCWWNQIFAGSLSIARCSLRRWKVCE